MIKREEGAMKAPFSYFWVIYEILYFYNANFFATHSNVHKIAFFYQIMPTGNRNDKTEK